MACSSVTGWEMGSMQGHCEGLGPEEELHEAATSKMQNYLVGS